MDGTFLRQWGSEGEGPGQFDYPSAVAVHGEEVIVCGRGNHRMQVFGLDGTYRRQWGTFGEGQGQFNGPAGVAVHGEEVIVCDSNNYRLQVFV